MATKTEPISEDQAGEALQQFLNLEGSESTQQIEPEPKPTTTTEETVETIPDVEELTEPVAVAEGEPQEDDDLTLLKKRNLELESQVKEEKERFDSKFRAIQERTAANQKILQDKNLRKSTALDKALTLLEGTRTESGVAEGDVDRVIQEGRSTMHPSSPSYVAPAQRPPGLTEEQEMIANDFFTEKGMTQADVIDFVKWYQADGENQLSATENAVALRDLDAFMRIAHPRWERGVQENKQAKTDDAVGAVKSVQRTQRDAARAASASTSAPRRVRTSSVPGVDVTKLTKDDVSKLLRQSVEQHL